VGKRSLGTGYPGHCPVGEAGDSWQAVGPAKGHKPTPFLFKGGRDMQEGLRLWEDVNFIYELRLAMMELEAFGVSPRWEHQSNRFYVSGEIPGERAETLKNRLAYWAEVGGHPTAYLEITRRNITNSRNQYLTHWFYPYKGKFHPQMIRALLNIARVPAGGVVLDPFVGSGTTALEAVLLGLDFIGFDISPVAVLQARVKSMAWQFADTLREAVARFKPDEILQIGLPTVFPLDWDETVAVTEFFALARLIAESKHHRRRKDPIPQRMAGIVGDMMRSVQDMREVMDGLVIPAFNRVPHVSISVGDARHLPIGVASVDAVVTSPPYFDAIDYLDNDSRALELMGVNDEELKANFIGLRGRGRGRLELYWEDMMQAYREMHRVLKPGGYAVIVVGNVKKNGKTVDIVGFTEQAMQGLGFHEVANIPKVIFGLYSTMKWENILVFQKTVS